MKKTPIIIDTDPGIDDSIAIITLAGSDNVEIKAITTTHGNVGLEGTTENALKLCELLNLDCPVAKGANKPMIVPAKGASDVHGSNGLGGHILPAPVKGQIHRKSHLSGGRHALRVPEKSGAGDGFSPLCRGTSSGGTRAGQRAGCGRVLFAGG